MGKTRRRLVIRQDNVGITCVETSESVAIDETSRGEKVEGLDQADFPQLNNHQVQEVSNEILELVDIGQSDSMQDADMLPSDCEGMKVIEEGSEKLDNVVVASQEEKREVPISYSNIVRDQKTTPLDFVILSDSKQILEDDPAFIITDEEWQKSLQTCKWQCILKFSMARPSLKFIKDQITSSWGLAYLDSVLWLFVVLAFLCGIPVLLWWQ